MGATSLIDLKYELLMMFFLYMFELMRRLLLLNRGRNTRNSFFIIDAFVMGVSVHAAQYTVQYLHSTYCMQKMQKNWGQRYDVPNKYSLTEKLKEIFNMVVNILLPF